MSRSKFSKILKSLSYLALLCTNCFCQNTWAPSQHDSEMGPNGSNNCKMGQTDCNMSQYACESNGDNQLGEIEDVQNREDCLSLCQLMEQCKYMTWHQVSLQCLLFSSCQQQNFDCDDCWTTDIGSCNITQHFHMTIDPRNNIKLHIGPHVWFTNNDVVIHKDGTEFSESSGSLTPSIANLETGLDNLGKFVGSQTSWSPSHTSLVTGVRQYQHMAVFTQKFTNQDKDIEGVSIATPSDPGHNDVATAFPCLVPEQNLDLAFLSYGGFMSGWAALSVTPLTANSSTIRDGEYGGPLVIFDKTVENVVIISPLNHFMSSSLKHRHSDNSLQYGLMGSITTIPSPGIEVETIVVWGSSLSEAFIQWGTALRKYHGKQTGNLHHDVASKYLGYWMDNGAYYYYNTLNNLTYEDTVLQIHQNLKDREIPVKYIEYDSWWYHKGKDLGLKSWTPLPEIFPNGMSYLQEKTGWPAAAHSRYWATDNVYSTHNGGEYNFIIEEDNARALPMDPQFWTDFFTTARKWGLEVYEQDWQDRQFVEMNVTHTDLGVGREWLRQMGSGAEQAGVTIQYCMSLPREILQSVEINSVTRARVSGDYILSKDNWRIGITSLMAQGLGLAPFKNVLWTGQRNPGNKFYYDCMEVSNSSDPNVPWSLDYRYTGYINTTRPGKACLSWYDLNWHWKFPMDDLERNGCRNPVGAPFGEGKPFCFYYGGADIPEHEWKWEECDIPVCEKDCRRPGLGDQSLPECSEYTETAPELQATVAVLSAGGVGIGDSLEHLDDALTRSTCRSDGLLLGPDLPLVVSPLQLTRMAWGDQAYHPHSDYGELWSSHIRIGEWTHGVVLVVENAVEEEVTFKQLGLQLETQRSHIVYKRDLSFIEESATVKLLKQDGRQFSVFHTSPVVNWGARKVALLGERSKIAPISGGRITGVTVRRNHVKVAVSGEWGEEVKMSWWYSRGAPHAPEILGTTCQIGKAGEGMVRLDVDQDGVPKVSCG